MDGFIERLPATDDDDLMLCEGVAYQRQMGCGRVFYGADYLDKVRAYEGSPIALAVNQGRCALLGRHAASGASVLDVGAGSGAFVRCAQSWGFDARGFDIIPEVKIALQAAGLYDEDPGLFDVVTMWDAIEHMEEPALWLRRVNWGALLFVSLPIFADLSLVRESKHYRPGEHLYYYTAEGFVRWIGMYGFRLLEQSDHEVRAGRDSIGAFAFRRER